VEGLNGMGEKDLAQLRDELRVALIAYCSENDLRLVKINHLDNFDETEQAALTMLMERAEDIATKLTAGWSVTKDQRDLDKNKRLHELGKPIMNPGDDYDESKATRGVVFEIETPFRPFTAEEKAAEDAKKAERVAYWGKRHAIRAWLDSGPDINTPPPDGIGIDDLLDQVVWWVTKDKQAVRIGEMEPSHRLNLFNLMERNAQAWKNAEFNRSLFAGALDDVWMAAENMPAQEWLNEQRLYQALRHLVLRDQVGVGACLIEWPDDKPRACLHGAEAHVCVLDAGHAKRCSCRCGARPAKGSMAAEAAKKTRRELASDKVTPEQQAMINAMFPTREETAEANRGVVERFMDLGAVRRRGLDPETDETMQVVHPYRVRRTGDEFTAEDIH
jgi:hypothetical protein